MPKDVDEEQRMRRAKRIKEMIERESYGLTIAERKALVRVVLNFLIDII